MRRADHMAGRSGDGGGGTRGGRDGAARRRRQLERDDRGASKIQIWSTITGPGGAALNGAYMCFTPLGRTYFTAGTGGTAFVPGSPMLGEVQISVQRAIDGAQVGITRTVIVPNSGATRITSR